MALKLLEKETSQKKGRGENAFKLIQEFKQGLESVKEAASLAPTLGFVDIQKITELIEFLESADRTDLQEVKRRLAEVKGVFEQNLEQFNKILGKLEGFTSFLDKLVANADLEHEVLLKVDKQLGK